MTGAAPPPSGGSVLGQVFDKYERRARLTPALLMLAPLIVVVAALYHDELKPVGMILSALAACGALFMVSDFARTLGKAKEKALWEKWGGMPSMQVLRHSDSTFDPVSKRRYHELLSRLIGVPFPSSVDEASAPADTDAVYQSACNKLRELTRDTKTFHLLFEDNITYGFRRNALGLRPWAIAVCVVSLVWLALWADVFSLVNHVHSVHDLRGLMSGPTLMALLTTIALLMLWTLFITEKHVRSAAFSYAQKLIEACEKLDKPAAPRPRSRRAQDKTGTSERPAG